MNGVHDSKDWHTQAALQSPPSAIDTSPKPSHNFSYNTSNGYPEQTNMQPYTNGEPDTSRLPGMIAPSQPATPRPERAEAMYQQPFPRNSARGRTSLFANESGPFFSPSEPFENLYSADKSALLSVRVQSKMDRGFFMADNDWTCYRRNYFQVSSVFSIHGFNHYYSVSDPAPQQVFVQTDDGLAPVHRFLLGVSARVANGDKEIDLIQHTPKRDKGPQFRPDPKPITPGGNLTMSSVANNQNIVTFERVQFKTATANNGKRRAAQQYYVCVVDLYAETERHELIKVASCRSSPLVVRGRSPGHYADIPDRQPRTAAAASAVEQEGHQQRQHVFATYSKPVTPTPSTETEYSQPTAYPSYYPSTAGYPQYAPTSNVQRSSSSSSPASSHPPYQANYVIHDASHNETYPNEFHHNHNTTEEPKMMQQFNMQQTGPIESPHSGFDWQRARYNSASSSASAPSPGGQQTESQHQQAYFSQNETRSSYSPTTPTYAASGRKYNNVPNLMNKQIA